MGKSDLVLDLSHTPPCLMPAYRHLCESSLRHHHVPATVADVQTLLQQVDSLKEQLAHVNEELAVVRKTLTLERQRYQNLLEGSPCAYIVTDIQGTIRTANHQAAALFNLSRADLVGKPLCILIAPDAQSTLDAVLSRLRQAKQVTDIEIQVLPLNEQPCVVHVTAVAFSGMAGDPITVRWLLQDVARNSHCAITPDLERVLGAALPADRADLDPLYVPHPHTGFEYGIVDRNQRQALLADVNYLLDPVCDCEDVLDRVVHRIVPYLADWCMIDLIDTQGQVYPVALSHQYAEMEDRLLDKIERDPSAAYLFSFVLDTIQTGTPSILADISPQALRQYSVQPLYYDLLADLGTRSVIVVPLWGRERVLGVVALMSAQPAYFAAGDLDLAEDLAHRIAHAVEHASKFCHCAQLAL